MTVDTATLRAQYERFDTCTSGEQVGFLGCALADKVPALCDALEAERARCADYRAACQAIQEGKAANEKRWRQRWNNLRRHTREQDAMLGRVRTERDAERERVRVLEAALGTSYYVDWEWISFFDPDDPSAPHEPGYRLYHVYEGKPFRMGTPVAHYRDEAEANADAERRRAALATAGGEGVTT